MASATLRLFTVAFWSTALAVVASPKNVRSSVPSSAKVPARVCFADYPRIQDYSRYRRGYPGHLFFAADNKATVYHNGAKVAELADWSLFGSTPLLLQKGDVIGLEVRDYGGWWGAVAALKLGGCYYGTTTSCWRARRAFRPEHDWRLPSYDARAWPRAAAKPERAWRPGLSPYFPYHTGARYVWAKDAGVGATIFLRFQVGDEC